MSAGDQNDLFTRLNSLTPASWFSDGPTPNKDAIYQGAGANLSWVFSLYAYALLQTRIATSTGVWLDKISWDYLGDALPRLFTIDPFGVYTYELDSLYRARIIKEILRTRVTRAGIIQAIVDLTGFMPILVEPWNPGDTAAYGQNCYYGVAGIYGSMSLRNQIFLTVYRPSGQGIANIAGYGFGYYGAPTTAYVNLEQMVGQVTDAQIYMRAASMIAAGITCWTQIQSQPFVLAAESGEILVSEAGLGPSRTNLLVHSNDFNTSWARTNCTVTANSKANPFQGNDGWLWQRGSTAAAFIGLNIGGKVAFPLIYTFSIFAQPGTGNFLAIAIASGLNRTTVTFDLVNQIVSLGPTVGGAFANASATITLQANGWLRCTLTVTSDSDTNITGFWSGNANNAVIDGTDSLSNTTIFAFGAQIEQAPAATNYIPTIAAQVTVTDSGVAFGP